MIWWRVLAAAVALVCMIWLVFFTEINLLQALLIAGFVLADYIGDRLNR